ncbi:DUF4221 family protein [Roseivirga sp. E12]|uniref:DUF4221 family protein n=1 Tax=Roseivirga sp. E12 TaxID=2819237 RepID=UPI001ABCF935|nr:DUF4221 family protein [Roseivirga sp. E12]MBO3700829.1 DUF4221 family protein [Roseivirga sp. E12]
MKLIARLIRDWHISIPFLFFLSCSSNNSRDKLIYSHFSAMDSLEVVMPLPFIQHTNWTTYRRGTKSILVEYGLDDYGNIIIHQVDFDKAAYLNPMVISREGPNGYNASNASVFFKQEDSIYVFPAARNSFFLYNGAGEKLSEYLYSSSSFERYYKNGYYSSLVDYDDRLILTTINDTRHDDPSYFDKVTPVKTYDFEKAGFTEPLTYPKYISDKHIPSNLTGAMIHPLDSGHFIINYSFSDSLYVHNIRTRKTEAVYCGANGFGKPKLLNKVPDKLQELEYNLKEVNYELTFFNAGKLYRVVSHLPKRYQSYSIPEIVNQNLRRVSLIEMDMNTQELRFYRMPIAKYFVFDDDFLIVGGVSIREVNGETLRKFYKYSL